MSLSVTYSNEIIQEIHKLADNAGKEIVMDLINGIPHLENNPNWRKTERDTPRRKHHEPEKEAPKPESDEDEQVPGHIIDTTA